MNKFSMWGNLAMIKIFVTAIVMTAMAVPAVFAGEPNSLASAQPNVQPSVQPNPQPNARPEAQPDMQAKNLAVIAASAQQGRSYLGVDIQDVTSDRVKALKLKEERGVEVTMVDQDAPAGKAGVKTHDVITEFNGNKVDSEEQLRRMIKETPPGRSVTLEISREGNQMKVNVQLADRSKVIAESHAHWPDVAAPPVPDMKGTGPRLAVPDVFITSTYTQVLGLQGEGLTRQLGEYFGVKNGEGVLVRSVEKGSAADKAGIKAGDVIVKADSERLTDRSDLGRILRSHRESGKINLGIVRDKREQTVTVELQKRGKDSSRLYLNLEELEPLVDADAMDMLDAVQELAMPSELSMLNMGKLQDQMRRALGELKMRDSSMEKAMQDAQRQLMQTQKLLQLRKLELNRRLDF